MPNVTSAPSRKKDKRKSLVVTTETVSSEILSPMTPAIDSGESNLENVNKNPYIDVLNKKVKKLRKTMTRIEKYENIKDNPDGTSLNNDQIKLLERKGETSGAIKEIDEALKQMDIVEKEELKKQAEQKRAQQMERDQAIASAVEEAKATLIHFQQREIIKLSEIEFEAVETLRAKLTTLAEEAKNEELYDEKVREVLDHVNKLQLGDESLVANPLLNGVHETKEVASSDESSSVNGVTYSQLLSLIQSPPILESSEEPQIEQDEIQETFEIVSAPNQLDDSTNVTIPAGGLQFMLRPDDQSQPQSTVDNATNTTYGYQSNDAEQVPVSAGDAMLEVYQQHQNYDTSTAEQQYIEQQQQFVAEQNDQQVSTEHEESSQQEGKEQQTISEDQADSKQPQTTQQDSDQPPPSSGHRGSGYRPNYRGNRGFRGQGGRRDSGGYRDSNYRDGGYRDNRDGGGYRDNYAGGYRDGGYRDGFNRDGNFRGARGSSGSRGGRGGGFQGNRGTPYRQQRSQ